MRKIFFFKNLKTQSIVDADERIAHNYYKYPQRYQYIGWSSGNHMKEAKKKVGRLVKNKDTGFAEEGTEDQKTIINAAVEAEIKEATENPDKTPPRDLTRKQFARTAAGMQDVEMSPQIKGMMGQL